ncbi:MAG: hypothetical protein KBF82_10240 [Chitinophagaceae bacterium]|nr:hypothetical protein [Chitinophagaceae bacterium]MBP9104233.1 hypothetical protein [Chitinophagaceae bacterium]
MGSAISDGKTAIYNFLMKKDVELLIGNKTFIGVFFRCYAQLCIALKHRNIPMGNRWSKF